MDFLKQSGIEVASAWAAVAVFAGTLAALGAGLVREMVSNVSVAVPEMAARVQECVPAALYAAQVLLPHVIR